MGRGWGGRRRSLRVPQVGPAHPARAPRLRPRLVITEQPKQRGMRFRYECEGRSAGSILGETAPEASKTLPPSRWGRGRGLREVDVVACLVWKDWPHRVHPHGLVGKDCADGVCRVRLRPHVCPRHSFNNLGIQCVRKREIEAAIERKIQLGIDPFSEQARFLGPVDMNVVRICFQASYRDPQGQPRRLEPVLSEPVYDKKSTNTSELRICRLNKDSGPCTGGEELYLLCDKVQKEDISVVFSTDSWEGRADFSQADVHRQIAIVLKTPPYEDLEIPAPVRVRVFLQRLTDGVCSDPLPFTYLYLIDEATEAQRSDLPQVPQLGSGDGNPRPPALLPRRRPRSPSDGRAALSSPQTVTGWTRSGSGGCRTSWANSTAPVGRTTPSAPTPPDGDRPRGLGVQRAEDGGGRETGREGKDGADLSPRWPPPRPPDPHGIESKRRQRKPSVLAPPGHGAGGCGAARGGDGDGDGDGTGARPCPPLSPLRVPAAAPFFPLPGLAEPAFVPAVTLPGLEPPSGPDSLEDYSFLFAHCGGGGGGGGFEPVPAVVPGPPPPPLPLPGLDLLPDAAPAAGHELLHLLDTFPLPGPPGEGTASLVGSNMFPNQYRDGGGGGGGGGGFALGLLQPGPEPT
uniref:Transcription factor RelB n=1 Tax=Ornithorhynchus anatinus TaxID=9258 RepID=A0A6I8MZE8_ORNAN